jgi:hypothetical protein
MNRVRRGPRPQQAQGLARWVVHLAILALLLKAAVPLLASAAARLQGVAVAQVCEVYGVALLPATASHPHAAGHAAHEHHALHAQASDPASKPHGSDAGAHHGEHCALGALAALAPPFSDAVAVPAAAPWQDTAPGPMAAGAPRDACARWVARLKHGPPLQA